MVDESIIPHSSQSIRKRHGFAGRMSGLLDLVSEESPSRPYATLAIKFSGVFEWRISTYLHLLKAFNQCQAIKLSLLSLHPPSQNGNRALGRSSNVVTCTVVLSAEEFTCCIRKPFPSHKGFALFHPVGAPLDSGKSSASSSELYTSLL